MKFYLCFSLWLFLSILHCCQKTTSVFQKCQIVRALAVFQGLNVHTDWNAVYSLSLSLSLSSNDIKLAHHDFVLWKGFILANVSVSWNSAMRCPVFNDSHVVCGDTFVCKIFQYTTVIKIHPFTNQKYV